MYTEKIEKFMEDNYNTKIPANGYVTFKGCKSLYVRFGPFYIKTNREINVFTISNIAVRQKRKGTFNNLLKYLKDCGKVDFIIVENLFDIDLYEPFKRKGFLELRNKEYPTSFYVQTKLLHI